MTISKSLQTGEELLKVFGLTTPHIALLKNRQIGLYGAIDDAIAARVIEEVLYLEFTDPSSPITLNIMSPGGSVSAGLAILDVLQTVKCKTVTVGFGTCVSMGALLLACGAAKGNRFATPNCEIMVHQPLSQTAGQQSDIAIEAEHLLSVRGKLDAMLAKATGQTIEKVHTDTERNNWLSASEALAYGLIDTVIDPHVSQVRQTNATLEEGE